MNQSVMLNSNHRGTMALSKQHSDLLSRDLGRSPPILPRALPSPQTELPAFEEEFKHALADIESQGGNSSSNSATVPAQRTDEDGHELVSFHKKD